MTPELTTAIARYLSECERDYTLHFPPRTNRTIRFDVEVGRKFVRIWRRFEGESGRSCHAFVVLTHPKFKTGDLLLPASWKAPAMNASRGNVFDPTSYIARWIGPAYLR